MGTWTFLDCKACGLHAHRTKMAIGRGDASIAQVLVIGEAPGISDDTLGKAFVGDTGTLMDNMLEKAGFKKSEVYFSNTVLCRPPFSREPERQEVLTCYGNLLEIVNIISPRLVILTGTIARDFYLTRLRKRFCVFSIAHPAAIIRNGGKASSLYIETIIKLQEARHEAGL